MTNLPRDPTDAALITGARDYAAMASSDRARDFINVLANRLAARGEEDPVAECERAVGQWVYRRIEVLMDAAPDTPGGAELAFLAAVASDVEEYGATGDHAVVPAPPSQPHGAAGEWVMVPREPTEAMAKAGRIVVDVNPELKVTRITTWGVKAWEAMIAAAPPSPVPVGEWQINRLKVARDKLHALIEANHQRASKHTPWLYEADQKLIADFDAILALLAK
jgi:hypothetical protein